MPRPHSLLLLASLFVFLPLTAAAQGYERIDVDDSGQPGNAGAHPECDMSEDGRFVVFASSATNLDALEPPTAQTLDVFLRDRLQGTTTRITQPSAANSFFPRISGKGNVVAYFKNGEPWYWVRATGVSSPIVVPGLSGLRVHGLDATGTHAVVTTSLPFGAGGDVYRVHLASGATVLCSGDMSGNATNQVVPDRNAAIDAAGTHVAFSSLSGALVPGDTNGFEDVFVYDIPGHVMIRASVASSGLEANQYTGLGSISANGRYVALISGATSLLPMLPSGIANVFIRDLRLGVTTVASLDSSQGFLSQGVSGSYAFVTDDGLDVAFMTRTPLDPSDVPNDYDPCLKDLSSGALLPAGPVTVPGLHARMACALSADGRAVLVSNFSSGPTSGVTDSIFVASFGPRCSSSSYCTSLPNSTGVPATIGAQGDASRALNNLVIAGVGLPDTAIAMLVSGTTAIDPGLPFGNGLMCVGGVFIRHGIFVANGGVVLDAQDLSSPEYAGVNPGDTRYYQISYRDPPAGGAMFNTTDAVAITFCW